MEGAESYTVDIAYVAIVDSLSEAGELIAEETYSFYERSGAGAVVYNTATGTPAQ